VVQNVHVVLCSVIVTKLYIQVNWRDEETRLLTFILHISSLLVFTRATTVGYPVNFHI